MIAKIHTSKPSAHDAIPRTELYLKRTGRDVSPQPPLENFPTGGITAPVDLRAGIIHARAPGRQRQAKRLRRL